MDGTYTWYGITLTKNQGFYDSFNYLWFINAGNRQGTSKNKA